MDNNDKEKDLDKIGQYFGIAFAGFVIGFIVGFLISLI